MSAFLNLVLAPVVFPTGIVLCVFYIYLINVNGTLGYFTGMSIFKWIPYVLAALLMLKSLLLLKHSVRFTSSSGALSSHLIGLIVIWMLYVLMVSIVNSVPITQMIVGVKQYILMWGACFLLAVTNIQAIYLERIWKIFLMSTLIQVPIILFQYVYFVGFRMLAGSSGKNDAAWDSIVGTFGGDSSAGGNSAGLAFFVTLMLVFVLSLMQKKLINIKYAILVLSSIMVTVMFAEIKVIFVMIPVALLLLYRADIVRNPLKALAGVFCIVIVMGLIFSNYQANYYSHGKDLDRQDQISELLDTVVKDDVFIDETGEMGRLTSLVFWWHENTQNYGLINTLVGHGMLSSRSQSLFLTNNLAADYSFHLDSNGLALLLWDFGLIGVFIYLSILVYGAVLSLRLSKNKLIPDFHRSALETGAVGLILTIIAIAHHPSPIVTAVSQSMMIFFIGQCVYWERNLFNQQVKH